MDGGQEQQDVAMTAEAILGIDELDDIYQLCHIYIYIHIKIETFQPLIYIYIFKSIYLNFRSTQTHVSDNK